MDDKKKKKNIFFDTGLNDKDEYIKKEGKLIDIGLGKEEKKKKKE